jgi:CRISPR-associated protein Cas2
MPLVTITLTKVPPSLRGTLSKWLQEIDIGVFVGNINSKIREQLWKRVLESIGDGRATISFYQNNEQGYNFATEGFNKEVRDFDGVSIITDLPSDQYKSYGKSGFSNASKYRKARRFSSGSSKHSNLDGNETRGFAVLDVETTGLDPYQDSIIEIGALKIHGNSAEKFERLTTIQGAIPVNIVKLTGITDSMLKLSGNPIRDACCELMKFIGTTTIIGWNIRFDIGFIHQICADWKPVRVIDVMAQIKKEFPMMPSFKLAQVAQRLGIPEVVHHRALQDCELTLEVFKQTKSYKLDFFEKSTLKSVG